MSYNEDGTATIDHFDFVKDNSLGDTTTKWWILALVVVLIALLWKIAPSLEIAITATPDYSTSTMMIDGKEIIIIEKWDGTWQAISKDPL